MLLTDKVCPGTSVWMLTLCVVDVFAATLTDVAVGVNVTLEPLPVVMLRVTPTFVEPAGLDVVTASVLVCCVVVEGS
jgi:hypothetical protein